MSTPDVWARRVQSHPAPPLARNSYSRLQPLHSTYQPPGPPSDLPLGHIRRLDTLSSSTSHINPSVAVIVIILSVVFILSGFLHLLARCLARRPRQSPPLPGPVSALHGQLQHLFHLHDAGVDQAFIDTLPVFSYGSIRGLKDSADCAVCLNEFGEDDRLRLLPKCKHAFHLDCIDTWLLSNSTCPLCRRSLLPDPTSAVESGRREGGWEVEVAEGGYAQGLSLLEPVLEAQRHESFRICEVDEVESESEIVEEDEDPMTLGPTVRVTDAYGSERILTVELGKVKTDNRRVSSGSHGARRGGRSYSMGSYEYIVDPSNLELMIAPTPFPGRPRDWAPSRPTHRSALSDSIPELGTAGGTPANDDLFWASRGLYTPQTLSRVRELLTPSPGSSTISPAIYDQYAYRYSPSVSQEPPDSTEQWIVMNMEKQAEAQGAADALLEAKGSELNQPAEEELKLIHFLADQPARERESNLSKRCSSLRLPEGKTSASRYRRSLSETTAFESVSRDAVLGWQPCETDSSFGSAGESSKIAGTPKARKFRLNWLISRDRRVVYSAASPPPLEPSHTMDFKELS